MQGLRFRRGGFGSLKFRVLLGFKRKGLIRA